MGVDKHRSMSNDTMTPLKKAVRVFNKHLLNPAMLHLAGRKHWYAAVIRHTGRQSRGRRGRGLFHSSAAIRHGRRLLRNLIAAGGATITVGGQTYDVAEPEILDAATAAPQRSPRRRQAFQRFGIDKFVKLKLPK